MDAEGVDAIVPVAFGSNEVFAVAAAVLGMALAWFISRLRKRKKTPAVHVEYVVLQGNNMANKKEKLERELRVQELLTARFILVIEKAWLDGDITKSERDHHTRRVAMLGMRPEWMPNQWQKILKATIKRDRIHRTEKEKRPIPFPDRVHNLMGGAAQLQTVPAVAAPKITFGKQFKAA